MKIKYFFIAAVWIHAFAVFSNAKNNNTNLKQSYFKLTSSNGMIVGIYNTKENRIDDVYPHIFANIDSSTYVYPFVGNIKLLCDNKPIKTSYLKNTHIIDVKYPAFVVNYFASFTKNDKIFYIVIKGKKEKIKNLSVNAEVVEGQAVSGINLLENHLQDLPIHLKGHVLTGNMMRKYNNDLYEKYILFSFIDSLHTDADIINKALKNLAEEKKSLVDEEVDYMRSLFGRCIYPKGLKEKEKDVVEQSISILKMSQVSDKEIFPNSHGQILASIRPGLWHIAWVRDGSFAIEALSRLGMFSEAKKALEFMLNASAGRFKHYIYVDGKDYGPGVDYQISLTRYFGNGEEECDYNEYGPNIEYDNWGLFMTAFCDYVSSSNDYGFYKKWNNLMCSKVADAVVSCIATDSLIKQDSGPWEHHLEMTKQYTFTSGVCARGLELFAGLQRKYDLPFKKYESAANILKQGILNRMFIDGKYFKGNAEDIHQTDHEYFDAGVYEIFANGLIKDVNIFNSHMKECDNYLRIKGDRPGYIRLDGKDPYENQEWVFIDLRISLAHMLFGQKKSAAKLLNYITNQASLNYNSIPEMISNKLQMEKVPPDYYAWNTWCNCIRNEDDQYIGTIPMVGYGSGAYIIALYTYYGE